MRNPINNFWNLKLESVKENLDGNNFEVFIAQSAKEAKEIALNDIIAKLKIESISWGGSMSFIRTGLFQELKNRQNIEVLNTFDKALSKDDMFMLRRNSLMVDLYSSGKHYEPQQKNTLPENRNMP